jgi:CRP-like cAMP-binding protein
MPLTMLSPGLSEPTHQAFGRRAHLPLPADQLWQIHSGVVRTATWTEEGAMVTLGLWSAGDILGRALSSANPHQAECLTEVTASLLPREEWHRVTDSLIRHIRHSEELLEILHCPQVEASLLRVLNWLAQRFGQESKFGRRIELRLTHQELAELIGSTRVTVTRLLSSFERRGLIQRQQRRITITQEAEPFWHYEI